MSEKLGWTGTASIKIDSSYVALPLARQVDLNLSRGEVDATSRADAGWTKTIAGLKSWSAEIEVLGDATDAATAECVAAWLDDGFVDAQIIDGNGWGVQGPASVVNVSKSEPVADVTTFTISLRNAGAATEVEGSVS